jgi:hypothetical protein
MRAAPARSATTPPTIAATSTATRGGSDASRSSGRSAGMIESFMFTGMVRSDIVQAPIATKARCPNESTPLLLTKIDRPTTITRLTSM